jgi:hypothetical protein
MCVVGRICIAGRIAAYSAVLVAAAGQLAHADIEILNADRRAAEAQQAKWPKTVRGHVGRTCDTIDAEARRRGLPPGFFARLIWKESRFDPNAVSPKGASGIAQFMPATARERGLADPFDPATALAASAGYLQDLKGRFGNLGLAAAAYNAGPDRVARWRSARSRLPGETRRFVHAITGLTAEQWTGPDVEEPDFALHDELPFRQACRQFARLVRPLVTEREDGEAPAKPWGALIASHFTRSSAEAALKRLAVSHPVIAEHQPVDFVRRRNAARGGKLMIRVLLGADDRATAGALCRRLKSDGGACIVVRN